MDTASSQHGELALDMDPAPADVASADDAASRELLRELWVAAGAEAYGLSSEELGTALIHFGAKHNHGQPPGARLDSAQKAAFYRSLRLPELALAQACALGRDAAWEQFLKLYRAPLTQAAVAITGSATLGHDLADSLYAELFGLRETSGERRSPLASYSGRGSLLGWLRTTLAQRHVDHHRRTYRETPLDPAGHAGHNPTALEAALTSTELAHLASAVSRTLETLDAEDRFLLASYFLDQRTLLEIARVLKVHEATISRRLKRLTGDLRKRLLRNLRSGGLSKRAADEALGADPRDLEINLRGLLQTSQTQPFLDTKDKA